MRDRLVEILNGFPGRRIAVIGDLIADEFLHGQIARISREAPVLVIQYKELHRLPGGAANAANNLLDLGCRVRVCGAIGHDEPGFGLLNILAEKGADLRAVRCLKGYATPVKTRILAGAHHSAPQQIVRVDRIQDDYHQPHLPPSRLRWAMRGLDAVIISDYGYGAITPPLFRQIRAAARSAGIPVVVDSRFRMAEFSGIASITPNITELEAAEGVSIGSNATLLHKVARRVLERQKLECLLVTQGRYGMTLFQKRAAPVHIPIFGTDEVADVTGAGDTVIACFSLALSCGASPEEAARLANYAGGIVVMKRSTATVTRSELRAAVLSP